jgi:hypothetical protein
MVEIIEYICVNCGNKSSHVKDPPICDYKFINDEYWCAKCRYKRNLANTLKKFDKKFEELKTQGKI